MEQISNICAFLCALCFLVAPIALIVWIIMLAKKSVKKKRAKHFFLGTLAGIILFTVIGVITSPTTPCEHEWETIEQIAPTCTDSGVSVMHCKLCDAKSDDEASPPIGHIFVEKTVQEASCTSTGMVEKTCSVCNKVESVITEKSPHAYKVTFTKEATLEASGVEESTCFVCGNINQKELTKLGTKANPGKVTVEQLVSEINSNKDAAKAKYNGQWIEITGKVLEAGNVAGMARFCIYGKFGVDDLRIICWCKEEVLNPLDYQGDTMIFLGQVREITTVFATEIGDCQIISD